MTQNTSQNKPWLGPEAQAMFESLSVDELQRRSDWLQKRLEEQDVEHLNRKQSLQERKTVIDSFLVKKKAPKA